MTGLDRAMKVVSDTSCITTLVKAGRADLLQRLFRSVIIPPGVAKELLQFHSAIPEFISTQEVAPLPRLAGTERLGEGEAQAIKLSLAIQADLLLTDDRKALQAARRLSIPSAGLVAVLIHAKRAKHITAVAAELKLLRDGGGLYVSDSVVAAAFRIAGE